MVARVLGAFAPDPQRARLASWLTTAGGKHTACVVATAKVRGLRITPHISGRRLVGELSSAWASSPGRAAGVLVAEGEVAAGAPLVVIGASADDPRHIERLVCSGFDELRRMVRRGLLRVDGLKPEPALTVRSRP